LRGAGHSTVATPRSPHVPDGSVDDTLQDGLDQLEGDAKPVCRHEAFGRVKQKRGDFIFPKATTLKELVSFTLDEILEGTNHGDPAAEPLGEE